MLPAYATMKPPFDAVAAGQVVPLATFVRDCRRQAADADWAGDRETARRLDREANAAIKEGRDPVLMF